MPQSSLDLSQGKPCGFFIELTAVNPHHSRGGVIESSTKLAGNFSLASRQKAAIPIVDVR